MATFTVKDTGFPLIGSGCGRLQVEAERSTRAGERDGTCEVSGGQDLEAIGGGLSRRDRGVEATGRGREYVERRPCASVEGDSLR